MEKTLKVVIGPTGIGKTDYAIQLAQKYDCPILNADSRQLYRDIPIGTAAPTAEEQARVKHYFVGTLDLEDYYSAAQYEHDALLLMEELFKTHDTLVMSGGSMMYVDAVCKGIDDIPTVDEDTRALLKQRYETEGLEPLVAELRLLDPAYYDVCDKRNPKRVVHALEICYMTGRTFTSFRVRREVQRPFRIEKIGLQRPREILFERINRRVDNMVEQGLLDEARRVFPFRCCNSLNTVGYKELFHYFDGDWELDFALEKIRRNSRVYAKKQMTWFKKDADVTWVDL
jgi:tRNA dimethylallyltransferase|uniref:tRNA (adenosine(37)-N6)-dimethylallyltransferase MiaA n=1 Tax=Alloprevotella sp. TaxID=1872471 RepID=UPI0040292FAE